MTADIKLLPLPEADDSVENHTQWPIVTVSDVWLQKSVQDYARAVAEHNVFHATEPLKAEIERLRAEVCQEQDYAASAARRVLMAQLAQRRAEARAEQLAEALRKCRPFVAYAYDQGIVGADLAGLNLDAALHPTAALLDHDKEGKDG